MQNFNIIKTSEIEKTYRVARIMGDFDVKTEHTTEMFRGGVQFPDKWQIGCIVGTSGTGKTTIAKEIFSDCYINGFSFTHKSVIDDMPEKCSVDEIEKVFYAVGFGSVPSWLKPFNVLSNGEKMRIELARALLEKDIICFDEFTSVVDRNVAETICLAIRKCLEHYPQKKFIAVTCHYDILQWLQPQWVFDTNKMSNSFQYAHNFTKHSMSEIVGEKNGKYLGNIII